MGSLALLVAPHWLRFLNSKDPERFADRIRKNRFPRASQEQGFANQACSPCGQAHDRGWTGV